MILEFFELMKNRYSIRKYTDEPINKDSIEKIIYAGMLSPSGRNKKPWEFIVVQDRETLDKMAESREIGSNMLLNAVVAIVVIGDSQETDTWIEDCSIAMSNMHLMAHSLGIGSCWVQGRGRKAKDGTSTENFLRSLLNFPENYSLQAFLPLGFPTAERQPKSLDRLPKEKIHWDKY